MKGPDLFVLSVLFSPHSERPIGLLFLIENPFSFFVCRVSYIEFHVNEVCKGMKYQNMSQLIEQLRTTLKKNGVFQWNGKPSEKFTVGPKIQQGVIRTNCLDCLDRTNLAQSLIALDVLPTQLALLGIGSVTGEDGEVLQGTAYSEQLLWKFRNIWADNGDAISEQYAGTGALKADFTRTGKRRIVRGGIADGMNSFSRYYLNNFVDGQRSSFFTVA